MGHYTPDKKKPYPCHTFGKSMLAKGPLTIHDDKTHTHTQFRNWPSFKKNTTMVMLMITTTTTTLNDKIRVVNLTGARGNRSVWWQVTTSNGIYWIYLCVSFHLHIFHFMFVRAGSIKVFRHDIMEHNSEIRVISRFGSSMLTCCTIKPL